jgi:hypothetical protein
MSKSKGKVTVGFRTSQQKEIEIVDFLQAKFKDNRLITVSSLENDKGIVIRMFKSRHKAQCAISFIRCYVQCRC